jgi:hypothetical protein
MARRRGDPAQGDPNAWPVKHPWNLLPRAGLHPYIPPRPDWLRNSPKALGNGYEDADGNVWVPAPHPSGDLARFHWDVQHPDGKHTNVRPDGEIDHGPDNL